jgi:hypothetical protein
MNAVQNTSVFLDSNINLCGSSSSSSRALQSVVDLASNTVFQHCIVFSTNLFLQDWDVNPMPNPQPGGPGCLVLVWNLTLDLSGLGDPASSYATAGIALEIIGARKRHRHDKAETPPGGCAEVNFRKSSDRGRQRVLTLDRTQKTIIDMFLYLLDACRNCRLH